MTIKVNYVETPELVLIQQSAENDAWMDEFFGIYDENEELY